ncbi:hypothetical protein OG2516_15020 [Oceanicola granulosus HTCC2516]|uniref:Secreted protein n=1 Tax=Oceanicola granulosus (strain ATCC BAA-861 / DSM 15982 / KCTC 12143 / HTCC2516) TaxID=314256 RepID=Q2CER1_OCEGH|nr:hypothetical protein [Oceanicola granulosus]EAR51197.1 hypothetical protein OG2516_15020 [Oceanicola granulosus HTCC2516]
MTPRIRRILLPALLLTLATGASPARGAECADARALRWLEDHLGPPPPPAGVLTGRQRLETPVWLRGAEIADAKYAVSLRRGPDAGMAALSELAIGPLRSDDAYGAGIRVEAPRDGDDSPVRLFLHDVQIVADWPDWVSYEETNYDGIDFGAPGELYGHRVRIRDWNADAALDIKADLSQFVALDISGGGNRPIRYWRAGPHDLVASRISRPDDGPLIWFADCDAATLRIFDTQFNGHPRLPADRIACESGQGPEIAYLSEDPRTTDALHPFLRGCPAPD